MNRHAMHGAAHIVSGPLAARAAPFGGSHRRGSALLVVLVVVMLLTLSAYTYTQTMQTEFEAAVIQGQDVQARQAADSGVDYVATLLARRSVTGEDNLQQNPAVFQGVPVADAQQNSQRARFSVIAALEADPHSSRVRYGLIDESAKLNLNLLDQLQKDLQLEDEDIVNWLMYIPGMTQEHIEAIRDWIDADSDVRTYGAESEIYQALNPPYLAKNGPLETLDELLLVRGVTPQLLYGEDANRNGLLDPNENDGDASMPVDNADGVLNHGWSAYLTVNSRERNLRADGEPKINLNNGLLTDLYDQLQEEFDETTAKFVVSYRMNGPYTNPSEASGGSSSKSSGSSPNQRTSSPNQRSSSPNQVSSTPNQVTSTPNQVTSTPNRVSYSPNQASYSPNMQSSGNSSSGSSSKSSSNQQTQQALQALTQQLAQSMFSKQGQVTRGGMDLSKGGQTQIKSIFDLVGSQTQATINSAKQTLDSPWPAETGQLQTVLPELMDRLSLSDDEHRAGRININQARPELLYGMPNMTQELVQAISAAQMRNSDGIPSTDMLRRHCTTGWLYLDGLVDLETMREIDPYLTARGDVFRAQVIGFFDGKGPVHRQEAIIDATRVPPRIVWQRDLNELGRGYAKTQLVPTVTQ